MAEDQESILVLDCNSLTTVGSILLAIASLSVFLNCFPFYTLLNFSSKKLEPEVRGFARTMRIYLLALIVVEMVGAMVVMPMFLVREITNDSCWPLFHSSMKPSTICAISFHTFFAYKLMSMFLITFACYSCFLYYNQRVRLQAVKESSEANNLVCKAQVSITTTASANSNRSATESEARLPPENSVSRRRPFWFVLMLITLVSLFIPSLPLWGLGPFSMGEERNKTVFMNQSTTASDLQPTYHGSQCTAHTFASPKMEKEYIFPFSLLMVSGGCGLILVYIFIAISIGHLKSSQKIFSEMTQFALVQGIFFLVTWLPLMVSCSGFLAITGITLLQCTNCDCTVCWNQ